MEDIEVKCLKASSEQIKNNYTFGKGAMKDLARYIDATLDRLEQLEKENKELKFENILAREENDYLHKNYIPKSEIKKKIEELNNQYREYNEKWENSGMNKEHPFYKYLIRIEAEVDILEELLEEK